MIYSLLYGALLAASALGAVVPNTHELHEKRGVLHARWSKGDRVASQKVLPMRIGLKQNMEGAEDLLMKVSDPSSPHFARYWTADEVIHMFQPSEETVTRVHAWLTDAGIEAHRITHADNKGWLAFHATNDEAERLLHTEFHEYHDYVSGGIMPSCEEYHLPKELRGHVDYVTPGIKLLAPTEHMKDMRLKRRTVGQTRPGTKESLLSRPITQAHGSRNKNSSVPENLQNCDVAITPACIQALYGIKPMDPNLPVNPNNSMGIYESEGQYYLQEDLNLFFQNYSSNIPNDTRPTYYAIDGAPGPTTNKSRSGGEVMLDLEVAYPLVYPQTVSIFQENDGAYEMNPNDTYTFGFNNWLDAIDGSYCTFTAFGESGNNTLDPTYPDPKPGGYQGQLQCGVFESTNVISISYGGQEADLPAAYQKRQCQEFMKLGMQGVSIFFASGDAGVGNYQAPYGFDNPKTGCLGSNGLLFNPTWPNNCPWITNVGGTKVYPGKSVYDPESAVYDPASVLSATNYSSGGGFSNLYPIPKYQKKAIDNFFKNHNPPYQYYSEIVDDTADIAALGKDGGVYNRIGRGIPDVAANGDNIATWLGEAPMLSGGTSASAPIFAAIVNRINEQRLNIGKAPVGFMNPTLYGHPEVLNDITNGSNPGCWTNGFSAVEGWDPVTGLGTPNYPKMLDLYLNLP